MGWDDVLTSGELQLLRLASEPTEFETCTSGGGDLRSLIQRIRIEHEDSLLV
jgi:hypothetical protein